MKRKPPQKPEPLEHEFGWNQDICLKCGMSYTAIANTKRGQCFPPEAIAAAKVFRKLA